MLRLRTFGGLRLEADGIDLRGAGVQRRPLALLSLLAQTGGMSRDKLLPLFWPEGNETAARNSLKQIIYALRKDLACPEIILGNTDLSLNRAAIQVDLWDYEVVLQRPAGSREDELLKLYQGPFLDGVFLSGMPEFERWAEVTRSTLSNQFSAACEAGLAAALQTQNQGKALQLARTMVAIEPLNDRFALSLMTVLAQSGDRAGALRHAETYRQNLKTEIGVEPTSALLEFGAALKRSGATLPVGEAGSLEPSPTIELSPIPPHLGAGPERQLLPINGVSGPDQKERRAGMRRMHWASAIATLAILSVLLLGPFHGVLNNAVGGIHYFRGRLAMRAWDTATARRSFWQASIADSSFAPAYLALAEIASWSPLNASSRDEQRWAAGRAAALSASRSSPSYFRAAALSAAANDEWARACTYFNQLIQLDSSSYSAWFGRAECLSRDTGVVPDNHSPSGWRFRTSYQEAIQAYYRAFEIRPDFHRAFGGQAITHLSRVLFLQPNRVRQGETLAGRPIRMAAFASWEGDSISFVPYPLSEIQFQSSGATRQSTSIAIAQNRETLRRLTALWTSSSPSSADAFEAHANVLELMFDMGAPREGMTAAQALDSARALSGVAEQRLRLAVTKVRHHIKKSEFSQAASLADSLLRQESTGGPITAQWLAPLAALTGRPNLAARLQRKAASLAPSPSLGVPASQIPMNVIVAWQALVAFAAMGAPADSIQGVYHQVEASLRLSEPVMRPLLRRSILQHIARYRLEGLPDSAYSAIDTRTDRIALIQSYVRGRQFPLARQQFAVLEVSRSNSRLADRWPDAVLIDSNILLAVGDTTAALAMIDPYLSGLSALSSTSIDRVETAASLARLMLLRYHLARKHNDQLMATHWRTALEQLWRNAEGELRSSMSDKPSTPQ